MDEMFVGVAGVSAEEAGYMNLIFIEWARMSGHAVVRGTLDIYKCFDQFIRPLIDEVLRVVGFPPQVVE